MKTKRMGRRAINALDPAHLVGCMYVGSDDILVSDGHDLLRQAKESWDEEEPPQPDNRRTLFDAMVQSAKGTSANSFDFLAWTPTGMVKLAVDWGKDGDNWMGDEE